MDLDGLDRAVAQMAAEVEELEELRKLDWKGYALRHSKSRPQELVTIEGPRNHAGNLASEFDFLIHEHDQLISVSSGETYSLESK